MCYYRRLGGLFAHCGVIPALLGYCIVCGIFSLNGLYLGSGDTPPCYLPLPCVVCCYPRCVCVVWYAGGVMPCWYAYAIPPTYYISLPVLPLLCNIIKYVYNVFACL